MNLDLGGRVALVTGGGRGIGAAVARELAGLGAAVAVNYRGREADALKTVEAIEAAGGRAVALQADVSDAEAAAALVDATVERLGGLDVLVNNAGLTRDNLALRMKDEEWRRWPVWARSTRWRRWWPSWPARRPRTSLVRWWSLTAA